MSKEVGADQVAMFLKENPEFFTGRDELLTALKVPHGPEGSVSLLEKQLTLLRDGERSAKEQLASFIETSKRNTDLYHKSRKLILRLIGSASVGELLDALEAGFKGDFECGAYRLVLFGEPPARINHFAAWMDAEVASNQLGGLMRAKKPSLGVLRPEESEFLFGDMGAQVQSAAVLGIRGDGGQKVGLLAIGSADPHYFSSDMDTLFIDFIADVVAKLLPRHLPQLAQG